MMGQPVTFGKRYNLTGSQYYTDEGYVDTFAAVVGVEPKKVFVPAPLMDAVWDGELELGPPPDPGVHIDIRRSEEASRQLVSARVRWQLSTLVQKIAPNLHRWNRSVVLRHRPASARHRLGAGVHLPVDGGAHLRVVAAHGPRPHAAVRLLVRGPVARARSELSG